MEGREGEPFLPLIIVGGVRSLLDEMDKLGALKRTQQKYQEGDYIFFSSRDSCKSSYGTSLLCFGTVQASGDCRHCYVELL